MRAEPPTSISIITPCLNRAEFIGEAIDSVLAQNYPNFEHIIIDGGSTDGTLEKVMLYPHLKLFSAPDSGMYEALNKGLKLINGNVIGFLNTDDLYSPGTFNVVASIFCKCDVKAVFGGAEVFEEDLKGKKHVIDVFIPGNEKLIELTTSGTPYFNAWFFREEIFKEHGGFNSTYKIVADRDFLLRLALAEVNYAKVQKPMYHYRRHSGSMTFNITVEKLEKIIDEHIILAEHYIKSPELSHAIKTKIKQLPAKNIIEMVIRLIIRGSFIDALKYIKIGIRFNIHWFKQLFQ